MCEEITVTLFTELGREGVALPSEIQLAILHSYQRNVTDAIRRFQDDARYNGVVYPYAEEEQMGVIFAEALRRGCERFTEGVTYAPALSAVTQAQRRQLVESWA